MNIMDDLQVGDIFLLASYSEGLPNTLLEGMAAGLLPITREVGGVAEVIPEALRRWMLPYETKEDLFAETISAAINLPDTELLKLREWARETCRTRFDIDVQAEKLENWLQSLVSRESDVLDFDLCRYELLSNGIVSCAEYSALPGIQAFSV